MPLVRVEVRNEYGLGMPKLYKEANKEDPKALLEGVAVAGLVGILRQLGDLAEFAAEVFHGLQEQVMNTSSRSHKLMVRVQNIEAAFPPLENTILAQRSHLHFAYTTGLQWHVRIQSERNHFIYSDLPRFIMDSYEECRGPPRLHLLDKFDTGGPGSCVKRYSDPTFFRRASAGFDEAYVEKVPRNKKARRRKKKKTWLKNGEIPHGVSHGTLISSHSGSMILGNFDGQTSPSQTVSTFNAALKSEPAEHSNSFDSRAGSGYIECVFSPSYSMKPDECEAEEISSQLKLHHSDTLDTSSLGEQSGVVNDEIQEQTDTRSSCVTWDEKTEIMEPTGLQYQFDETTEKLPTNFNPDPPEGEAVNIRTADQMEFNFDNESMLASVSCGNQLDDIESETDNYMDALNTIELESEIDLECQTKREVEQFSSLNNKEADGETNKLAPPRYLDSRSSNSETHVPAHVSSNKAISEENHNSVIPESPKAANSFLNKETSIAKPSSVPSEFYATEHSPQEAGKSSSLDTLPDIDSSGSDEILDGSNVETVVRNLSSSVSRKPILQAPKSDTILSSSCESQKSPSLPSGVTGVNFWTNGGLLGLEPSKPPDFSVLNSGNHESMAKSKGETFLPSNRSTILEGDRNALKTNIIENSDFHHSVSSNKPQKLVFSETSTKIPGTEEAINLEVQATKSLEYDGKNSSRMFEFSNRLLVNGFQKKASHFGDGNLVASVKNGVSEQKSGSQAYKTFPGRNFKEQFGCGSPFMSPSSPPLEHMKISFQPIDGFETHKLKLKLPDGSECHESSGDMFPSFQLVPEKSISLQDLGSDSDDDTFCRSSPRPSDDCLSHYSESDSEEWETGESPRCKDHEIYDALGPESVSNNLEIGRMAEGVIVRNYGLQSPFTENGMEPSHSGGLHDLPSFDTLNTSLGEELHRNSDAKYPLESDFSKEPTPSPPPLPPVEWCAMNPNPDVAIEKQDSPFEAVKHAFDQKLSAFTISHQPKPAPVEHDQNTDAIACTTKSKQPDLQKLNGQNDADQPSNSKGADEKEDFLQQIRTKSFSLRRTMTDRQTTTPGAPANVSVTAILEKANAIRQAVGSDDGEDDTWSDA